MLLNDTVLERSLDSATEAGFSIDVQRFDPHAGRLSVLYCEWAQLFARDQRAMIVQHPQYVLRETGRSDEKVRRPIYVVTARQGDTPAAIGVLIPKVESTRQVVEFGPACPLQGYRLCGNRFLGEPAEALQQAMLQTCLQTIEKHGAAFLLIEDLVSGLPLWNACQAIASEHQRMFLPKGMQARLQIEFKPGVDYWSQFTSKRRWNFRHKIKKFGDHHIVRATHPEHVAEFLENAHQISRNSWQAGYLGVRIANTDEELDLLTFLATEGALRSYMLFQADVPAAFVIGTQYNGYFDHSEIAYDLRFADQSPGQVLLLKLLEDLVAENTPQWLDFGGGDAEYKQVFGNHESQSGNVWLVPQGLRATTTHALLRGGRASSRAVRWALEKTGLRSMIRRLVRRGAVNRQATSRGRS